MQSAPSYYYFKKQQSGQTWIGHWRQGWRPNGWDASQSCFQGNSLVPGSVLCTGAQGTRHMGRVNVCMRVCACMCVHLCVLCPCCMEPAVWEGGGEKH